MAREFAKEFYHSMAWRSTQKNFARSKSFLCERCLKAGLYSKGEIVHHKIHLTPENINDKSISLSWDNLELLCRKCHAIEHQSSGRRYLIDGDGTVIIPPNA